MYREKGEGAILAKEWKTFVSFVLHASGATDKPSQYTKKDEMKARLAELDRHWKEFVPEDSPVVAEDLSASDTAYFVEESGVVDGLAAFETTAYAMSDEEVRRDAESLLTL